MSNKLNALINDYKLLPGFLLPAGVSVSKSTLRRWEALGWVCDAGQHGYRRFVYVLLTVKGYNEA